MTEVNLNMDFDLAVAVDTRAEPWSPSPAPGVERKRLERENAESGRATSIVRYAPASAFPTHVHGGGEEFLVIDGVFSDENGDYPEGTYVRNPPGSSHAPFSRDGCVILVKLCQMAPDDQNTVVFRADEKPWTQDGDGPRHFQVLNDNPREWVTFESLASGAANAWDGDHGGLELYLVKGRLTVNGESRPQGAWLRYPNGTRIDVYAEEKTVFWLKRGHLDAV